MAYERRSIFTSVSEEERREHSKGRLQPQQDVEDAEGGSAAPGVLQAEREATMYAAGMIRQRSMPPSPWPSAAAAFPPQVVPNIGRSQNRVAVSMRLLFSVLDRIQGPCKHGKFPSSCLLHRYRTSNSYCIAVRHVLDR